MTTSSYVFCAQSVPTPAQIHRHIAIRKRYPTIIAGSFKFFIQILIVILHYARSCHPFLENASMPLFCRSSDLLPFVLPSHLYLKDSGLAEGRQTYMPGAYSSGTVRDFHPIPFSSAISLNRKSIRNKTLQIYIFPEKQIQLFRKYIYTIKQA